MYVWIGLIGGSTLIGVISAMVIKKYWSVYVAAAVPWFILLAALIYTEYFSNWEKGGLGNWLLAQFLGGTIAATIGFASCKLTRKYFRTDKASNKPLK